jgi:hypothetical protein
MAQTGTEKKKKKNLDQKKSFNYEIIKVGGRGTQWSRTACLNLSGTANTFPDIITYTLIKRNTD